MFSESDLEQLRSHGISVAKAEKQLQAFRDGFPELDIVAPATIGNGVLSPTAEEEERYIAVWKDYLERGHKVLKFVPASGAASRMFKDLFAYEQTGEMNPAVETFLSHRQDFAFAEALQGKEGKEAVTYLLHGMRYGELPKGLLLFHRYEDGARTPALEHLAEGAMYAASKGEVHIHFTVSHDHLELFKEHIEAHREEYEKRYGVRYEVTFSEQKPSTDTLAANPDGSPFRTEDGKLLFRPGGHGALIENLADQDADIIFVKNIDNVVPDRLKADTVRYKQVLAGVLVAEQQRVFAQLADPSLSAEERKRLQRPIRVCGVVKNTGEPGGGPFLVRESDGSISCQILESTQVTRPELMKNAAYFNPVDLVCATRDKDGKAYRLTDFVDENTAFISHKSKDGKELLALELPGLWNGAMSRWNTLFVEVPAGTFNPVKTVNDLLREQHL